jgi:putative flippase GtrA
MIKDLFYFFLSLKAVRYFFAAGIATLVDVAVYYMVFNHVLHQQSFEAGDWLVLKAPTFALICSYSSGLVTNFGISRLWVFTESELSGHHQFIRFILVALVVLIANYFFMYFLIRVLAITIGLFSFLAHKTFSFKI